MPGLMPITMNCMKAWDAHLMSVWVLLGQMVGLGLSLKT